MRDRRHALRLGFLHVIQFFRQGQSAVFADAPEVIGHQREDRKRDERNVHGVKVEQCVRAHFGSAEDELTHPAADNGYVADDACANRDRPERELIPRQKIAGEVRAQREQQHGDTDQPVDLTRRTIRTRDEDTDKMKHCHHDQ